MDTIQTRDWAYSASASSLGSVSVTSSLSPSDCTTTTSSTVPGLGEFSGRAILALGKLTLRGAEYVILRRRLDVISAKFPHQNTDKFLGIDQMYKDILEFSRRDFYLDTIRDRALTMILVQIGSRQTQKLIEHLLKWPFIEIKIFITELTTVFDPLKLHSVREAGRLPSTIRAYTKALSTLENHTLEPFIIFLQGLATGNDFASQAILEGGVMDYLLHLYVSNFFDPLEERDSVDSYRRSTLNAGCNSLLRILSAAREGLTLICGHSFHILWPDHPELPFTPLVLDRVVQRAQIWKTIGMELALWRIRSMMEMMVDHHRPYKQEFVMDIVVDALDFSGSESAEPDIFLRALRLFYRSIITDRISIQHAIRQYLALSTSEYFVKLMSRIIVRVSHLIVPNTPEWGMFFLPWEEFHPSNKHFFDLNAVLLIAKSFIGAARHDQTLLTVILEANILGLLRPFLQQEFRTTQYLTQHSGDKIMVYDAGDFNFLAMIREHGLPKLYPPVSDEDPGFVNLRRAILSWAFDILLRRGKDITDTETIDLS